jgi:hypothetical protein
MSLNEIYDNPSDDSVKVWQDYRFNNLEISNYLDVDTQGASAGDILQLDGTLEPIWIPFANISSSPLDHCVGIIGTNSIPTNGTQITVNTVAGSPVFSLSQGGITCSQDCIVLVFLNITTDPTQFSLPLIRLVKRSLGVSTTITEMSPYLSEIDDVYVSTNCVAPVQLRAGDVIQVFGVLIGNSSNACALINNESNINIVRIN